MCIWKHEKLILKAHHIDPLCFLWFIVFLFVFICINWSSLYKDNCTNVHNAIDLCLQIFNHPHFLLIRSKTDKYRTMRHSDQICQNHFRFYIPIKIWLTVKYIFEGVCTRILYCYSDFRKCYDKNCLTKLYRLYISFFYFS